MNIFTATIDQYSASTVPIQMLFGVTELSIATAFVWEDTNCYFLITNWHNVSGKDPRTQRHLSPTLAEPDRLRVWWNRKGALGAKFATEVPIRDANGAPLWWVHPMYNERVDVICLPITAPTEADMHPINKMSSAPRMQARVGQDVFILGYPFGIGPSGLPIWKRGSFASEPEVTNPDDPYMLIDTATRPGMSGSPVIRRSWGSYVDDDGGISMGGGDATRFIGVYSGRLSTTDSSDAQLGLAWPAALVEQIIAGKMVASG